MGKKLSFEYVEQHCRLNHNQSMYIFGDKHGYRYNVNHPLIRVMIDTEAPDGFYDTGLFNEFVPKGDTVKVYSFDATKRLFGIK